MMGVIGLLLGGWAISEIFDSDSNSGGNANETQDGTDGNDALVGTSGSDILNGMDGDDTLHGKNGSDTLNGGDGDDDLFAGVGSDTLNGDDGNDTLLGGDGLDTLMGGAGNDDLFGGEHVDNLHGGEGDDLLSGGGGADALFGDAGNDTLKGGLGQDVLVGGEGEDTLEGGSGADEVYGLEGVFDNLSVEDGGIVASGFRGSEANAAADELFGNAGDDVLYIGNGDVATGGEGDDLFALGTWLEDGNDARIADFDVTTEEIVIAYGADDGLPAVSFNEVGSGVEIIVNGDTVALVNGVGLNAANIATRVFLAEAPA